MPSIIQSKDHRHAAFTQSFIQRMRQEGFRLTGCEVPFNHYGDRGVIDVVLRKHNHHDHSVLWLVCEMKPQFYDIGETIRQIHRAQEYFCKARPDLKINDQENIHKFALVLEANQQNLSQLNRYHHLFQNIHTLWHHEDSQILSQYQNLYEIQQAIIAVQRCH